MDQEIKLAFWISFLIAFVILSGIGGACYGTRLDHIQDSQCLTKGGTMDREYPNTDSSYDRCIIITK